MTQQKSMRTKCLFCSAKINLQFHHNYPYGLLRYFINIKEGQAKGDAAHRHYEKKCKEIRSKGGIVPLCKKCHALWDSLLIEMIRSHKQLTFYTETNQNSD